MKITPPQKRWISLGEASELLGIHPATLRAWADREDVRAVRTPGGHRRFLLSDIEALMLPPDKSAVLMPSPNDPRVDTAVASARQDVARMESANVAWLTAFAEQQRMAWRESGQKLVGLAFQYVANRHGQQAVLEEAEKIGYSYGHTCVDHGISLSDTVQAFFFFRESVLRASRPGQITVGRYEAEEARIHREMRRFFDAPFYTMLEAYDQFYLSLRAGRS